MPGGVRNLIITVEIETGEGMKRATFDLDDFETVDEVLDEVRDHVEAVTEAA